MPVSPQFRDYVLEQIGRVTTVTWRAMFGGGGLYADGGIFGVVDDNAVYLKVDDSTRPAYEAAGMGPFRPFGPDGEAMMGYWQLPPDALEDTEALGPWIHEAVEVGRRSRARRARGKPSHRNRGRDQ